MFSLLCVCFPSPLHVVPSFPQSSHTLHSPPTARYAPAAACDDDADHHAEKIANNSCHFHRSISSCLLRRARGNHSSLHPEHRNPHHPPQHYISLIFCRIWTIGGRHRRASFAELCHAKCKFWVQPAHCSAFACQFHRW